MVYCFSSFIADLGSSLVFIDRLLLLIIKLQIVIRSYLIQYFVCNVSNSLLFRQFDSETLSHIQKLSIMSYCFPSAYLRARILSVENSPTISVSPDCPTVRCLNIILLQSYCFIYVYNAFIKEIDTSYCSICRCLNE